MMLLIGALDSVGAAWSIENPRGSYIWQTDELKELLTRPSVHKVDLAQCEYLLRPPDYDGSADLRVQKYTSIVTNMAALASLARPCSGQHTHVHALGSCRVHGRRVSRAALAGRYPKLLCSAWARSVRRELEQRDEAEEEEEPVATE